jgi:regulator of cell morphogenesis and NO signaling
MIFSRASLMADVINNNFLLLPVINRFGVQLGFGNKSIADICKEKGINEFFFLEIINSYNNIDYKPEIGLEKFSLQLIVQYLSKTHTYFRDIKLPDIELHINKLVETARDDNKKNVLLIKDFFVNYESEINSHFDYEDKVVYPYCQNIENAFVNNIPFIENMGLDSIKKYATEHLSVDEKLDDLKNIIIKYLPPTSNYNLCNTILIDLFYLDNELKKHESLENRVLIPRVANIEKLLKNN